MELPNDLKITLDKTFNLALGLEEVSSMITPKRIGDRGRKRLLNINKEIKNLSQIMKFKSKKNIELQFKTYDTSNFINPASPKKILVDLPAYQVKKKLSLSIKEINHRVKLSRAGKRSVGKYMNDFNMTPLIRDLNALNSSTTNYTCSSRLKHSELNEEKPQPYISLTNGKIEDPITLPSFQEFLESTGDDFIPRKGNDELLFRISKATEQINRLEHSLDQKLISLKNQEEKKVFFKRDTITCLAENKPYRRARENSKIDKKTDLRSIMDQYYKMPSYYSSPKSSKSFTSKTPSNNQKISMFSEAEEMLDESSRTFHKSKAVENRKLTDILDKISIDRPYSIKKKIQLIQKDKEKYKNKHHSIEKFNSFRESIEKDKRGQQYKNYEQGLVYLEILDEFKRKKYEPLECELLILEL